ncbi:hypothetical protein [Propionicimonas sp.]|uniref:hypothetical protein n=1 Tax=Propionicimonas sp. TaxID=1955623 RepID=UPI00183FB783|nr:hypothetical protein [Propionicimonas sp.]MBU3978054.1 hypothetical protein [Actinomycetota bacterium]MBA3021960.1 hypothetical protein [Propionicimonas sp.]MBU3985504.1 hypothetical protein [Actinomycetota bacterium]MBU4007667.1 hypothetical protein [Actinomycetota bacterium]MBU4064442.1 hypothetical protein [Actinomycetota bacterium]
MSGLLILIAMFLLIVLALQRAHRRTVIRWRPGIDTRNDRDLARLEDDLLAVEQRSSNEESRVDQTAPRWATTDARLITRTAA